MSRTLSALLLTGGRVLGSLFGIATAMTLSRCLSQEQYGSYQQAWLIFNTLAPLLVLGLPASIVYFVPRMDDRSQKMVCVQTAAMLGLAGLVMSVVTYLGADVFGRLLGGGPLAGLLRAFFFYPVLMLPLSFTDTLLVARGKAAAAACFNLVSSSLQFAAVAMPAALGSDVQTLFVFLNVSALVQFTIVAAYVLRTYRGVPMTWDLGFIGHQMRYCLPLGLSAVVGTLTLQCDRILVSGFLGASQYALYVNGATELPFAAVVTSSVMTVITPELVRLYQARRYEGLLALWHSATRKVALLFIALTAFLTAFATDFVTLLFSARYADSAGLFRIFLLLLPLRATVFGALLMAAGRSGLVLKAAVATLVVNLVLNLAALPTLGLAGAACATVFSVYLMAMLQLNWIRQVLEVGWGEVFPWRALGQTAAVASAAAAIARVAVALLPSGPLRLALGAALFAAAAVPLGMACPGLKEDALRIIASDRLRALAARFQPAPRAGLGDVAAERSGPGGGAVESIADTYRQA